MSRLDQYNVTVSIDGVDYGTFDKKTGGDIDSEEVKYKPGAMAPQISLGGSVSVSNIMVDRLYRIDRDPQLVATLKSKVGKGVVTVTQQLLDINGAAFGSPIVFSGRMKTLKFPEPDSESRNPGLLSIEVSSAGIVG